MNIPKNYLSCYSDGKGWGLISNGLPIAQGSYDDCIRAADKFKIELPAFYWSGDLGKFINYHLEPVNTLDITGYEG